MRSTNAMDAEDVHEASRQAVRGAVLGAVKWGAASTVLGGLAYMKSPLYRSFTIQFKIYIHMSCMIAGGVVGGDKRMQEYEAQVRAERVLARDRARWQALEREFAEDGDLENMPQRPAALRDDPPTQQQQQNGEGGKR